MFVGYADDHSGDVYRFLNIHTQRIIMSRVRSPSNQTMERANISMDPWIQETYYISTATSGPDEPNNFNEAWNHHCIKERRKWREAIAKELYCMENKRSGKSYIKQKCQITEG